MQEVQLPRLLKANRHATPRLTLQCPQSLPMLISLIMASKLASNFLPLQWSVKWKKSTVYVIKWLIHLPLLSLDTSPELCKVKKFQKKFIWVDAKLKFKTWLLLKEGSGGSALIGQILEDTTVEHCTSFVSRNICPLRITYLSFCFLYRARHLISRITVLAWMAWTTPHWPKPWRSCVWHI